MSARLILRCAAAYVLAVVIGLTALALAASFVTLEWQNPLSQTHDWELVRFLVLLLAIMAPTLTAIKEHNR